MKRTFDLFFAIILLILFLPLMIVIGLLIRITSPGPAIHWSKRVGLNGNLFLMPKFRTMYLDTPDVATHLLSGSRNHITSIGRFLRKSSLDELPQLLSVLRGEMSFVGPRPALFNQGDLISMRDEKKVNSMRPGITGWAQINGRDEVSLEEKVKLDHYYLINQSFWFDVKIMVHTFSKVFCSQGVSH